MRPPRLLAGLLALCLTLAGADEARAQATKGRPPATLAEGAPTITAVFPPGAVIGEDNTWTVTGRNLRNLRACLLDRPGVEVIAMEPNQAATSAKVRVRVSEALLPGVAELRLLGDTGLSNLALIRLDRWPQVEEIEPNDRREAAQAIEAGTVAVGTLRAQDVDRYRVELRAGQRLTIEVEARRLGVSLVPIITLTDARGSILDQARETAGLERDARLAFEVPADGEYGIEVRDAVFAGAEGAAYRLRVVEEPFATARFPLGGPPGAELDVTLAGGSLAGPVTERVTLPDRPGEVVDLASVGARLGPFASTLELAVGELPECFEPGGSAEAGTGELLEPPVTINGRLDQPGEVDSYRIAARKGQRLEMRVQAAGLGSWLDSVLTVRNEGRALLAENDDRNLTAGQPRGAAAGMAPTGPAFDADSRLEYEPKSDGPLVVELADRYGLGGPEYSYRLSIRPVQPDIALTMLLGPPGGGQRVGGGRNRVTRVGGLDGVLHIKAGQNLPVNFQVMATGVVGSVEVRAEGLPPGVTAEPVTVKISPPRGRATAQFQSGAVTLKAAPGSPRAVGWMHLVATAAPGEGPAPPARTATAFINIDQVRTGPASEPVGRELRRMPVVVVP